MKAIILVSSIFYLLGLTISNNINIFKKGNSSGTEVTKQIIDPVQSSKNAYFGKEIKTTDTKSDQDSTKNSGSSKMVAPFSEKGIE